MFRWTTSQVFPLSITNHVVLNNRNPTVKLNEPANDVPQLNVKQLQSLAYQLLPTPLLSSVRVISPGPLLCLLERNFLCPSTAVAQSR